MFDFVQGQPVFDFGDGVTVDAVTVPGGTGPIAEVAVTAAHDAALGYHTVTVVQGADTGTSLPDAWKVEGRLPASDSCAAADALDPLVSTTWRGTTLGLTDLGLDTSGCGPATMPGPDAVYRVDVPAAGSGISATLETLGHDGAVYLVRGCSGALPVACQDIGSDGDSEVLSWTAGAGEAGTWYLVVDSRDADGASEFSIALNSF